MKSTVETLSPTRVKLTVDIPFTELGDNIQAAYARIATQVNVPGFRKGKVPSQIIDQRFGRGAVLEEVINEAVPQKYDEAIQEAGIVAVAQPDIDVTEVNDLTNVVFTAEVDVRPEFDLPEYKGIEVQVEDAVVTGDDVDEQLLALQKRFATALPVERAAQDDDLVIIDVEGTIDGERLEDFSATALSYEVGSGGMVTGADEAIRGLSEGESATFTFTPEETEQAGKEISIFVTVKGVRERELPDADNEFAQMASEFDTLDELRDDLLTRVKRMRLVDQGMAARQLILDKLLAEVEIPVPESMVDSQIGEHFEDGHGDDDHKAEVKADIEKAVKTQFILDKIADVEELTVGQAELTQWLMVQGPRYGMSADQFADALVQAGQVPMAVADVRRGKALAFALQNAKVTDESGNEVDLSVLDEPSQEDQLMAAFAAAQEAAELAAEDGDLDAIEDELAEEIAEDVVSDIEVSEEAAEAVAEEASEGEEAK